MRFPFRRSTPTTLTLFLIGLFLFSLSMAHSGDMDPGCLILLKKINSEIKSNGLGITDDFDFVKINTSTVKSIDLKEGIHGGKRITLERIGSEWGSAHTTVLFDPQGDPRFFIETVGSDVAEYFGFHLIDDHHMTIPDATEFNGAVRKVNGKFKEKNLSPMDLYFYQMASNENSSVSAYVAHFVYDFSIPMASTGNHLLHDISFHTGGIFLPSNILSFMRMRIAYENDFFNYLNMIYQKSPEVEKAIKYYQYVNNLRNTIAIDNGTAGLNIVLPLSSQMNKPVDEEILHVAEYFTGGEKTPKSVFLDFIDLLGKNSLRFFSTDPEVKKKEIEKSTYFLSVLSIPQLKHHFEDFSKIYKTKGVGFNPDVLFGDSHGGDKLVCKQVHQRRLDIRNVVLELMREH